MRVLSSDEIPSDIQHISWDVGWSPDSRLYERDFNRNAEILGERIHVICFAEMKGVKFRRDKTWSTHWPNATE
jgi:hypothetical protein